MTGGFGPRSRGVWCNDSSPGAVARLARGGFDWVCLFDPIADIDVVHVLLADVIAAEPGKEIPVAHLVFQF